MFLSEKHVEILSDARASARGEQRINVVVTLIEARWIHFPRIRPESFRTKEKPKREIDVRTMGMVLLMQIENVDHHITSFLHFDDFAVARYSSKLGHGLIDARRFF